MPTCSQCNMEIEDHASVWGLTRGSIDAEIGFMPDMESEWHILCPDCMNKIDELLATRQ